VPSSGSRRSPGAFDGQHLRDLLHYLTLGGVSAGVDLGLLVLLREGTPLPLAACTATAFASSLVVNFSLNRRAWVGGGSQGIAGHGLRYLALVIFNLVLTVVVVTGAAAFGVPYVLAKVGMLGVSTCWNYVLYRTWVFT
jgi:putative flippase GtrA